jgi:hypothetical protein
LKGVEKVKKQKSMNRTEIKTTYKSSIRARAALNGRQKGQNNGTKMQSKGGQKSKRIRDEKDSTLQYGVNQTEKCGI